MDTSARKRIVIVGGGFAGLYAALHLERTVARDPWVEVLLIDPQNFLLFTPMLHEVASGSLDPSSIVVPTRQSLRRVQFFQAETTGVDFDARTVTAVCGLERRTRKVPFDYLLIAGGSRTRFPDALRRHAHGMKTIQDALILRNWLIGLLERAELEADAERRKALLTIAVAGGGFSGVETIGAINDFLRDIARNYRNASKESPSLVLVEPLGRLLPEFEPALGEYTAAKLRAAGIDVRLRTKVAAYDGRTLSLDASPDSDRPSSVAARTLIWTAGIAPSPLIESLALRKERGRIVVDSSMAVPGHEGVWACGDCAAVPDPSGKPYPTTAQLAVRQGRHVGVTIAAAVRGRRLKDRPFRYRPVGQLAAIGRGRAVGTVLGLQFSGFLAWVLWRSAYLLMLPRLDRKIRVLLQWTIDVCFPRDTVQLLNGANIHSGRLEDLIDSARAADSTAPIDAASHELPVCNQGEPHAAKHPIARSGER
jgi:NADH:ubiquinone reductase (H+-translocating)